MFPLHFSEEQPTPAAKPADILTDILEGTHRIVIFVLLFEG